MNDTPRKTILLVDDSLLTLAVTRDALEEAGYAVLCARNLDEMERHRGTHAPDLILMDVQMPEAFGDDVAMVLRGAKGIQTPIYLLSTLDDADLAVRVREAQIDGYIPKRLGVEGLIERVREILPASARSDTK
jgi:DNA-binding response OmpR family regulator